MLLSLQVAIQVIVLDETAKTPQGVFGLSVFFKIGKVTLATINSAIRIDAIF